MTTAAQHVRIFRRAFKAAGDPARATGERAYLKSDLRFYGVTVPHVRRTAKAFRREYPDFSRDALWALTDALWETRWHELRTLGVALLEAYPHHLRAGDMKRLEALIRKANTWAHVDWLAVKLAGDLVTRFPGATKPLARWARDDDFWIRRAAMLALMPAGRSDERAFAMFARFAAGMLHEREFFIRKAIGWVLRDVSKVRPDLTYAFLLRHRDEVSGLTMREGSKYLSKTQRETLARGAPAKPPPPRRRH